MSYFRENIDKIDGYQPGFQPSQKEVIKLNTNENPYPPSPDVMKALAEINAEQLRLQHLITWHLIPLPNSRVQKIHITLTITYIKL